MLPEFRFLGISLYYWGYILAFAADFIFNLVWYRKKYKFKLLPAFLSTALIVPLGYALIILLSLVHKGGVNWVRAVLFIPAAVYLLCLLLRTNYAKTIDFLTPTACINHGVSHIFCIFQGCCYGYPFQHGIWNEEQQAYLFPIQLVEAASILLICAFIVWYAKRHDYNTHGVSYAQHLILFGLTRFLYEFFRDDTPVRWQLSQFQYYCIAEFALGLVVLFAIRYSLKHKEMTEKHPLLFREDIDEVTRIKLAFSKQKTTAE